jgi:hypothetical protein
MKRINAQWLVDDIIVKEEEVEEVKRRDLNNSQY